LIDLNEHPRLKWLGDSELNNFMDIEFHLSKILKKGAIPFSLGGDHSVAYPILRAVSKHVGKVTIIQFDAHNDLYHDFEGNPYSHASPFARIMEGDLAARLIQVGIRTMTTHQQQQASDLAVEVYSMQDLNLVDLSQIKEPIYISFDMDVLDPAFAPGVSHHEPGGMSTREAISMLQSINAPIVGMDLVEYNPHRDPTGMTGMVAAKIAKEMLALLLR
jgi:agmatinase